MCSVGVVHPEEWRPTVILARILQRNQRCCELRSFRLKTQKVHFLMGLCPWSRWGWGLTALSRHIWWSRFTAEKRHGKGMGKSKYKGGRGSRHLHTHRKMKSRRLRPYWRTHTASFSSSSLSEILSTNICILSADTAEIHKHTHSKVDMIGSNGNIQFFCNTAQYQLLSINQSMKM